MRYIFVSVTIYGTGLRRLNQIIIAVPGKESTIVPITRATGDQDVPETK